MKLGEFKGPGYDPKKDRRRLHTQVGKIYAFMKSGEWHTLAQIEQATGAPQASASAALRAFRRADWGSYIVDRRRVREEGEHCGTWEYKLSPPEPKNVDGNGQVNLF